MSTPTSRLPDAPEDLRLAWFSAPDRVTRASVSQHLTRLAQWGRGWAVRSEATRVLIELLHLADHPRERKQCIETLAEVDSTVVVPALHAELQHPDRFVRQAALRGIGRLGRAFGGVRVATWLAAQSTNELHRDERQAALWALSATGHPSAPSLAIQAWHEGHIDARTLHLCLADAVSDTALDLAEAHVLDPHAATAAALHLANLRVPKLEQKLRPLLRGANLERIHIAENLIRVAGQSTETAVLDLARGFVPTAQRMRAARRLKGHRSDEVLRAFIDAFDLFDAGSWDRRNLVEGVLMAGIAEVQAGVLDHLDAHPSLRAVAYEQVSFADEALRVRLDHERKHAPETTARAALRALATLPPEASPVLLQRWMDEAPRCLRIDIVRCLQAHIRDQPSLPHRDRLAAEAIVRTALSDDDPSVSATAAYCIGNGNLTPFYPTLRKLVAKDPHAGVRVAAAIALRQIASTANPEDTASLLSQEPNVGVRFRLAQWLLRQLQEAPRPAPPSIAASIRSSLSDREDLAALRIRMEGYLSNDLKPTYAHIQARSLTLALAALDTVRDHPHPDAIPHLRPIIASDDPDRRLRAVEALGRIQHKSATRLLASIGAQDSQTDVRRAALGALLSNPTDREGQRQLIPQGPEDPLLFEVLQAREAAIVEGRGDLSTVDDRLSAAIPGLPIGALTRRCPDALRALRTAEHLGRAAGLPEHFDAAPPVLFWVKGLELWLHERLEPYRVRLRSPPMQRALQQSARIWPDLRTHLPAWQQDAAGFRNLLSDLCTELEAPHDSVLSLRGSATVLLVGCVFFKSLGVQRWRPELPTSGWDHLTWQLYQLARVRNRFTHREAASTDEVRQALERAVDIARGLVQLG